MGSCYISHGESSSNFQNGRKIQDGRREQLKIINISQTINIFNKHKEQNLLSIRIQKHLHMSNFISNHEKLELHRFKQMHKHKKMRFCVFPKNFLTVKYVILIKEQNNAQRYFASLYQNSTQNIDSYGR